MAWAEVQKSAAEDFISSGTSIAPALPSGSTQGNLLVAALANSSGSGTWTLPAGWVQACRIANAGNTVSDIWYYPANPGGITSVTCTSAVTAFLRGALAEFAPDATVSVSENPFFETDVTGWGYSGGTLARSSAEAHSGSYSGLFTPDGASTYPQVRQFTSAAAGVTYTFSPWLYCATSFSCGVYMYFYDADNNQLGNPHTVATVTTAWQQLTVTATAPAGTAKTMLQVFMNGTPAVSDLLYVDDAVLGAQYVTGTGTGVAGASKTCPVTTGTAAYASDLAVACFHERFSGATATTYTDPSGYTVLADDTASSGHHMYSAYRAAVPDAGVQTVTATSVPAADNTYGWTGAVATFSYEPPSAGGSVGVAGLVGALIDSAYLGGGTLGEAITDWITITGRPLAVRRRYYGTTWPSGITTDLLADQAAGRKIAASFTPALSPPTGADQALLNAFLASCKDAGLDMDVALYPEPYYNGWAAADVITATQYYAATVRQYYPLVFCTAAYSVAYHDENAWYAGDDYIDKITTDYYADSYVKGVRLGQAAALADNATSPKPFGVWELNASTDATYGQTQAQGTAYFGYLQAYFAGRLAVSKTNADLLIYNSSKNLSQETAITDSSDYRVALWQSLYDTLGGATGSATLVSQAGADVTVTSSLAVTPPPLPPAQQFPVLAAHVQFSGGTWTDITSRVRSGTISRPSTRQQGPVWTSQPGTCSLVLNNADGRFDPDNTGGPYHGHLIPMVPVRIFAGYASTSYALFSGYADAWSDDGANYGGHYAEVTLTATDAFKVFSGLNIPQAASTGSGDDTGTRIKRILNKTGYTGRRAIDAGDSQCQPTTYGDSAMSLLQLTADTELGQLYIAGNSAVTFRHRKAFVTDSRSKTAQAIFGDAAGTVHGSLAELPYTSAPRADDDATLCNDCQITAAGSANMQESVRSGSEATYLYPRTYTRSDLLLTSDAEALAYAQWITYVGKDADVRFASVTLSPRRQPADLYPQALGREFGDRITIYRRPPGVAAAVTRDCFITGISHDFDVSAQSWVTTFTLADATRYGSFLTLDDSLLGKLDSDALAY